MRKRLINKNPFADQLAAVTGNAAKCHFISREDTTRLLKACPDLQWRLIVLLARFGRGYVCPSEILALHWHDMDRPRKDAKTSPLMKTPIEKAP